MIERREHLRLTLKPCQAIGVAREGVGQGFDRDMAIELGVSGSIDLAL